MSRTFVVACAALLAGATFLSQAHGSHRFEPECPDNDPAATDVCIAQRGDNETDADIEMDISGGDGVAGSQVIGGAGIDGDVSITANNESGFATARGGDAEADLDLEFRTGPEVVVEGGDINVEANATGVATVTQTATPNVSLTLSQFSNPSGNVLISNSAVGLTTLTGAAPITQTASILQRGDNESDFDFAFSLDGGDGVAGSQVIGLAGVGAGGSVSIDASNQSGFATARGGDADLDLDIFSTSGPRVLLGGGNTNVVANATGVATVTQTAAPNV